MAAKRKGASGGKAAPTELAIGDVILWKTPKGSAALWVLQRQDAGAGVIPILELLDWVGDALPEGAESLTAAQSPHPPLTKFLPSERWFLAKGVVVADDPKGRWRRVRTGFRRASFVPSKASEHGLGAPFVDANRLHTEVTAFVANKLSGEDVRIAERALARQAAAERADATPPIQAAADAWEMKKSHPMAKRHVLSLTGPGSHVVWIELGVGNMYVGCEKQRRSTPQAIVDADARLVWGGLESLPRWLHYEGNDPGVFDWLRRREKTLERLELCPRAPFVADATGANVDVLVIVATHGHAIRLTVGSAQSVRIEGGAKNVTLVGPGAKKAAKAKAAKTAKPAPLFAGWSASKRKKALAAYDALKASVATKAKPSARATRRAVEAFADALNAIDGLFTLEREGAVNALSTLFAALSLAPLADDALAWFDARRDF